MKKIILVVSLFLVCTVFAFAVGENEYTFGTKYDVSIDPHFNFFSSNAAFVSNLFAPLVGLDMYGEITPGIAESWRIIDDFTWEFKIRKGVKFSDGSDFTPEDFLYSLNRIETLPNNPSSYAICTKSIKSVDVIDNETIVIHTKYKNPFLPNYICAAYIVSKNVCEKNGKTEDFNSGVAAVGTGQYKFVEYVPADRVVIEANEYYYGDVPAYSKVTYKFISHSAARVAALLSGDVDIIDEVPPGDIPVIEARGFNIFKRASTRPLFIQLDQFRDVSPFITDKNGKPIKNPLLDVRVRRALSMAINKKILVENVMKGLAEETNQILPRGWFSFNENIPEHEYNPVKAMALLKEAGYPDGFAMTIHGPSDRYVNDYKIIQAIGQMISRIGISIKVETFPMNIYFGKLNRNELSFTLLGWDLSQLMTSLICARSVFHTVDEEAGFGLWNAGRYSNPKYDALIEAAEGAMDREKYGQLLQEAMHVLIVEDQAALPLYVQYTVFAGNKKFNYTPRPSGHFQPSLVKPAN